MDRVVKCAALFNRMIGRSMGRWLGACRPRAVCAYELMIGVVPRQTATSRWKHAVRSLIASNIKQTMSLSVKWTNGVWGRSERMLHGTQPSVITVNNCFAIRRCYLMSSGLIGLLADAVKLYSANPCEAMESKKKPYNLYGGYES